METIGDAFNIIVNTLKIILEENEAKHQAWLLINFLKNYSRDELLINQNEKLTSKEKLFIAQSLEKLKKSEPIQYVLGRTSFMELPIIVNKSVLIPRPETEELVEWIVSEIGGKKMSVLDIGTGSGCIACSIKKYAHNANVEAWDISKNALKTAKMNAKLNNVQIKFKQIDILNYHYNNKEEFDVIISNPPYVTEKEKTFIQPNVLNYEPHSAIFVPNEKPLLFYEKIIEFSHTVLKSGGHLFFEINQLFGNDIVNLLKYNDFENIELRKDISGRDRMVKAKLKKC